MKKNCEIAIVGRACRLPGANSVSSLWTLLQDRTCAVTQVPSDRWSLERFGHPRQGERGRSYTWAAGVLDDIWGFDAAAFGVSPREADQMDPQQRLLLELTWEALEDAGIPPSSLAGTETGVFVGASTTDYGNSKMFDLASTDGYFATGNAASILANRISYIYDLNGPSFTVDTACSSSMVALDAAVQALEAGRIETAIVGGVSILAAPFQFINFSQASMLSRVGLCQAFSAKADGYVRSEGGGVLVLRAGSSLSADRDRVHATIVGTRINSDGRTNGIALPSKQRQARLLDQLYRECGVDPESLAFVEAHGTGTPVGDPIEATALGEVLGMGRTTPLPIGSIKSNIGHTEAAAGVAGIIKATLALEHDLLPATLHADELNPNIDFDRLNLKVATAPVPLERTGKPRLAGVSSYGFGGTNSHVILAGPPSRAPTPPLQQPPRILVLSAHSRTALAALAGRYADVLDHAGAGRNAFAAAANHRRDLLPERVVLPVERGTNLPASLRSFAEGGAEACPSAITGTVSGPDPRVAFVYAGNGSQWVGMGRTAYRDNADFRARFDEVDALFQSLSGWSLVTMMTGDMLADQIAKTSVAQPLIFAIQAATTRALARMGLVPDLVLGHSVGEVAAAEAAGALDLPGAVKVIYYRSFHQELAFDRGGMAVLVGPREAAQKLAAEIPDLSVAAYNSPRATTLSGSADALHQLAEQARRLKVRIQKLDIRYPFHSALIGAIEGPLLADLAAVTSRSGQATFVSTVTGTVLAGDELDPGYWWRNVREPVLFAQGIETAAREGARIFVEIGPNPILLSNINDVLSANDIPGTALAVHDRKAKAADPFRTAVAGALARGARVVADVVLGSDPGPVADLPSYPWQRKRFRIGETAEAVGYLTSRPWHPLAGARFAADALEWHSVIDTVLEPALADHVVDGHILLPGAAFAEMALAVARDWLGTETAAVADFEIHQPMILVGTASRDVRCRLQPVTGTLEIMSRPRFGQGNWQVHAVAKLLKFTGVPETVPAWSPDPDTPAVSGSALYPMAARSGLQYGPAFQQLETAYRAGPDTVVVDLVSGDGDGRYGFDPVRVDACFHGLVLLFADLAVQGRMKPYVPVAIADIKLYRPGTAVARAYIHVLRSDERTIVLDFTLVDRDNRPVAVLHRSRFQAMNAFRAAERPINLIARTTILAAEPLAVPVEASISSFQVVQAAQAANLLGHGEPSPDYVLLEGWATAVAFGLFETLARSGVVALDQLAAEGRMPASLLAWCDRLLAVLERSGLVRKGKAGLELVPGHDLPDPRDILKVLAAEHPDRSAELLLAARTEALVGAIAAGTVEDQAPVTPSAIEAYDFGAPAAVASARALAAVLDRLGEAWPGDRALRILQVGDGPLSPLAVRLAKARKAEFTLLEMDRRRLERARLVLDEGAGVAFAGGLDELVPGSFDLVVASHGLHRLHDDPAIWGKLADAMGSNGVLIALEPEASVFRDLVFGLQVALAPNGSSGHAEVTSEAGWARVLNGMNLGGATVRATVGTDFALLCTGHRSVTRHPRPLKGEALVICDDGPLGEAAAALATMLKFSGLKVASLHEPRLFEAGPVEVPETLVYLAQGTAAPGIADRIAERCLRIKALAALVGTRKTTLWIVCPGATRMHDASGDPAQAAVWAFVRTLANEVHALDVRLVDLAPGLAADVAARRLRDVILSGTAEKEVILDASSTRVVRFEHVSLPDPTPVPAGERVMRLVKGEGAGLDRLTWHIEHRREPGSGEIEVAVEAAGLNFRDVMWGLSILPEEILEDGYAGATLGLECAGRVVRLGPGVDRFKVGDRVLAFAKAALATHVTVAAAVAAPIPDALSAQAAATVPVAFLTAYYALIRCARLDEEEWVLIHGGAGGVGLAAIQIARWRGARIIATAGSAERRDLLQVLGAEHVFDSRSTQFVEDVRRVTGSGVDVVLNSLSGEAMERSIATLRPFGRFVELGKRDYVANTHIGLKPFRRNLSYFGVDLDQLIVKSDTIGQELFTDVMGLFVDGSLSALPYRVFEAAEVVEAFRVMQRSGHVGKIVITPPAAVPTPDRREVVAFAASPTRTHLITGGLGGFGLATARWLADHGARHMVLTGRSGAATDAAREAVAQLRAEGIAVEVASVDVTNETAVAVLLTRIGRTMPPLGGVIHAATVFDDAIVANLTEAKLRSVLAAKATGAAILDRLTRATPLDYFVLYSSATTLIGNPGQGAYVAANAYLEALAQGRRRDGLPGFAVAWGAIEDVGILARSGATTTNLLARSGVLGMSARSALDHLAEVLARVDDLPDPAVLAVASVNWSAAREHLPVLRSPSFGDLMRDAQGPEGGDANKIAVRALVEQEGVETARRKIADTVQEEIARILRLPREDVSRTKPLMEIGLDSLMAVELGMALEERFTLEAPLSTSAGVMTVTELADYVVGLAAEPGAVDPTLGNVSLRHLDADIRREMADVLPDLVQDEGSSRRETVH